MTALPDLMQHDTIMDSSETSPELSILEDCSHYAVKPL